MRTKSYRGQGPEIVWVGEGAEVCALGTEADKYHYLKTGRFDVVSLGLRLGFLKPGAAVEEVIEIRGPEENVINISDVKALEALESRWHDHLYRHTGVRSLVPGEFRWSPHDFVTRQDLQTVLPRSLTDTLAKLGTPVEILRELPSEEAIRHASAFSTFTGGPSLKDERYVEVKMPGFLQAPFAFKVDLGAPLPKGWDGDTLGLSVKEVKSLNAALVMAHEAVYRTLLNACLHPAQVDWKALFAPERMGLYLGCGLGPHDEQEGMFFDTFRGENTGAKTLANSIGNIANGYIAARLGIKGKISTHMGACETCLGSIGDAYWDLKAGRMQAAVAGGFDDVLTAASYNGFTSNQAFTTNEKLVENVAAMIEEGAITDARIKSLIQEIQKRAEQAESELGEIEAAYKQNTISLYDYQQRKRTAREKKRLAYLGLPKEVAGLASMPFAKYRSGFVMGVGAGAGFFTTLERAIELGLPIRAILSGVSEMVPDGGADGAASIAALGDGVGDAYARAFEQIQADYGATINDVAAWFAHGTSTPLNGYGERKEIERVHQLKGRDQSRPILITGDKAEVGHRIAGNFPSLVGYIFATHEILPVGNYRQAGFSPKGRRGFGEPLDDLFPSSKVVGQAGLGGGKPVAFKGDFIAVNGAGFGRINTVLIFRRFVLDDVEIPPSERNAYQAKLAKHLADRDRLSQRIRFKQEPLIR